MTTTDETARLRQVVREMANAVRWRETYASDMPCVVCGKLGVDRVAPGWLGLHSGCLR